MRRAVIIGVGIALVGAVGIVAPPSPTTPPTVAHVSIAVETFDDPASPGTFLTPPVAAAGDFTGATWAEGTPDQVEIRALVSGRWTPWREVDADPDHSPDPGTAEYARQRGGTEPTGFDHPAEVQYRFIGDEPVDLDLDFVDVQTPTARTPFVASANAGPAIQPRSAWDPNNECPPRREPEEVQVDVAFVHHTGLDRSYSQSQVPGIILGYCLYHRNGREFDDIAYNFLIDRFGTIWEGRAGGIDKAIRGGHTQGFSSYSTGIALIGNYTGGKPSSAQQKALTDLLAWKLAIHNVDPLGRASVVSLGSYKWDEGARVTLNAISGHRDAQATACPGAYCYALLPEFRATVAQTFRAYDPTVYGPTVTGDFTGDGAEDGAAFDNGSLEWTMLSGASTQLVSWGGSPASTSLRDAVASDINGDDKTDIVAIAGSNVIEFTSTGTGFTAATTGTVAGATRVLRPVLAGSETTVVIDDTGVIRRSPGWTTVASVNAVADASSGNADGDADEEIVSVSGAGTIRLVDVADARVKASATYAGTDRVLAGSFGGRPLIAAVDMDGGIVRFLAAAGGSLTLEATVDLDTMYGITEVVPMNTPQGTTLLALDGLVGVWKAVMFDGPLSGYTVVEDQPFRTSIARREPVSGSSFLSFFAKESRWVRTTLDAPAEESNPSIRVTSPDRYSMNVRLTSTAYAAADEVIIATGTAFPDALAAGAVAARRDAVLLLTAPGDLPGVTAAEIRRLGASSAVIAGGEGAVSAAVESKLTALGLSVSRIGGIDRYQTAAYLSRDTFAPGTETVYIATGRNFPDALTSVPLAAATGSPVLLVSDTLPGTTAAELRRLDPQRVVILGGPNAVGQTVVDRIADVVPTAAISRLAGDDRYGTAVAVSRVLFGGNADTAFLTVGTDFPDALIAGPVGAHIGAPILLTTPTSLPPSVYREVDRLGVDRLFVIGSTSLIDEDVTDALNGLGLSSDSVVVESLPRP